MIQRNKRPKLKLKLGREDFILEFLGFGILLVFWVFVLWQYSIIPDTIPIHYDFNGKPDSFGDKNNIWTLPVIALILFVGLTYLNRFPHLFNYLSEVTESNAEYMYRNATRLIRVLKLSIVFLFFLISIETVRYSTDAIIFLGPWFLPITLVMVYLPLVIYLIKESKRNEEGKSV